MILENLTRFDDVSNALHTHALEHRYKHDVSVNENWWGQVTEIDDGTSTLPDPRGYNQNENPEDVDMYSILSETESFRCEDGNFTFELRYPNENIYQTWAQTSNPLNSSRNEVRRVGILTC